MSSGNGLNLRRTLRLVSYLSFFAGFFSASATALLHRAYQLDPGHLRQESLTIAFMTAMLGIVAWLASFILELDARSDERPARQQEVINVR